MLGAKSTTGRKCRQRETWPTESPKGLTIATFRLHLDKHLLLTHDFDDLADVRARLLQELKLLPQQANAGVERVTLRLEPTQVLRLVVDCDLGRFNLVLEVRVDARWRRGRRTRRESA